MKVVNQTKGRILSSKVRVTNTAPERMRGLLGRDGLEDGEALYISPCTSIHSFFMRFVFDAVFIGKDGSVLHIISRMKKWRISKIVPRAAGVLELAEGLLEKTETVNGDILVFEHEIDSVSLKQS